MSMWGLRLGLGLGFPIWALCKILGHFWTFWDTFGNFGTPGGTLRYFRATSAGHVLGQFRISGTFQGLGQFRRLGTLAWSRSGTIPVSWDTCLVWVPGQLRYFGTHLGFNAWDALGVWGTPGNLQLGTPLVFVRVIFTYVCITM